MVPNRIPRVFFFFLSTERISELFSLPLKSAEGNSKLFSLPLKGSERNSESLFTFVQQHGIPSCFLFRGRVRNGIPGGYCSAEQPEFRRK
jgi:hypothetical protein